MSNMEEFKKDIENNKRGNDNRAERFKLKNGDNKVVILTNPIGFSTVFGIGIAYEDCGYGQYAGRKYKCYVFDMADNKVKIADFSYTTAKKLSALSEGARTAFDGFPMPYAVNLKTDKAGTKEVETDVLAMEDYELTDPVLAQLEAFSPIQEVIDNLKKWQKKQNEENPEMKDKIEAFLEKKEQEQKERDEKRNKDKNMLGADVQIDPDYPEGEEIETEGEIPF